MDDTTGGVAGEGLEIATGVVAEEEEDVRVPEMAEGYNRFPMDLVEREEPQPPATPMQILVRRALELRGQVREMT